MRAGVAAKRCAHPPGRFRTGPRLSSCPNARISPDPASEMVSVSADSDFILHGFFECWGFLVRLAGGQNAVVPDFLTQGDVLLLGANDVTATTSEPEFLQQIVQRSTNQRHTV